MKLFKLETSIEGSVFLKCTDLLFQSIQGFTADRKGIPRINGQSTSSTVKARQCAIGPKSTEMWRHSYEYIWLESARDIRARGPVIVTKPKRLITERGRKLCEAPLSSKKSNFWPMIDPGTLTHKVSVLAEVSYPHVITKDP